MPTAGLLKPRTYRDSVALMVLSSVLSEAEGVLQASGPAITVRLAVDRDRSDAARRVEAIRTQHAAKLVANPLFS